MKLIFFALWPHENCKLAAMTLGRFKMILFASWRACEMCKPYFKDTVFGPVTTTHHVYDVAAHHVVNGVMEGGKDGWLVSTLLNIPVKVKESLKQNHKVIEKDKEHHKKKAKEVKKLGLSKIPKVEKDLGIPNDWPFKEQELKVLESIRTKRWRKWSRKKLHVKRGRAMFAYIAGLFRLTLLFHHIILPTYCTVRFAYWLISDILVN
nr:guanine nucleotide-binding protein-like NSN1 [Tanacetum cinerariifolium]